MSICIGLNGFGRIGRYLIRLMAYQKKLPSVAVINARADNASLAHLFKYDSVHGIFQGSVAHDEQGLIIDGYPIKVTQKKTGEWLWKEHNVNVVVESTGTLKTKSDFEEHIKKGATKVLITAASSVADIMLVLGVNTTKYNSKQHAIISAASCTTNCLAPVAKTLHDTFTIDYGCMTTIHSYTMSQRILDGSQKDLRRARAAALSLIPTTTGAAKSIGLIIPDLEQKLDGIAIRVPTPNVSLVDFTCKVKSTTTKEAVNTVLKTASETTLKTILGYSDEPLVSIDYTGSTYSGVVDSLSTMVMGSNLIKTLTWYDNEAGFTNQLIRLLQFIEEQL